MRIHAPVPVLECRIISDGYHLCASCGTALTKGDRADVCYRDMYWPIYTCLSCTGDRPAAWKLIVDSDAVRDRVPNVETLRYGWPMKTVPYISLLTMSLLDDAHVQAEVRRVDIEPKRDGEIEINRNAADVKEMLEQYTPHEYHGQWKTVRHYRAREEELSGLRPVTRGVPNGRNVAEDALIRMADAGILSSIASIEKQTRESERKQLLVMCRRDYVPTVASSLGLDYGDISADILVRYHNDPDIEEILITERKLAKLEANQAARKFYGPYGPSTLNDISSNRESLYLSTSAFRNYRQIEWPLQFRRSPLSWLLQEWKTAFGLASINRKFSATPKHTAWPQRWTKKRYREWVAKRSVSVSVPTLPDLTARFNRIINPRSSPDLFVPVVRKRTKSEWGKILESRQSRGVRLHPYVLSLSKVLLKASMVQDPVATKRPNEQETKAFRSSKSIWGRGYKTPELIAA